MGASLLVLGMVAAPVLYLVFYFYRDWKTRKSLHQGNNGVYVWTDWHGGERTSDCDPSAPGGDWSGSFGGHPAGDGGGDGSGGGGGD